MMAKNEMKDNKFELAIASWLAERREEKGLSQEALGVQLGKGQSDIAKIENANRRVTVVEFINWMAVLSIPYERIEEVLRPIYNQVIDKSKLWGDQNGR